MKYLQNICFQGRGTNNIEIQNYFVLNNIFKQNAKTYQTKPVLATRYKTGMESGWMIYINNVPSDGGNLHTHAAVKFFPIKEDAISYVEANEKQYMKVNGNLVECEVEYSLLQPVLHRKRTDYNSKDRVGVDFMLGDYTLASDESSDYDFYILEENTWIIQDANGKIRVWDKDFLDCGKTFFGNPDNVNIVCEKIGENTYKEVEV